MKTKGLKVSETAENWFLYAMLFLILSWTIMHYKFTGYYQNINWFFWSFIISVFLLFFSWFSYSHIISKIFMVDLENTMKNDLLALTPLVALFLRNYYYNMVFNGDKVLVISLVMVLFLKFYFLPFKDKMHLKKHLVISYVIFILIPSLVIVTQKEYDTLSVGLALIYQAMVFLLIISMFNMSNKITGSESHKKFISLTSSFYYILISLIIGYWIYTGNQLDIFFFFDSRKDILTTGINIFGYALLLFVMLFVVLLFLYHKLFMMIFKTVESSKSIGVWHGAIIILGIVSCLAIIPHSYGYIFKEYGDARELSKARAVINPYFSNNSIYSTGSEESIFILQLESGNSLALFGNVSPIDGIDIKGIHLPYLYNLSKEGILFPLFWSNTMQTNRAQESIFCGINNNLRESFSYNPDKIENECLPRILNREGYKTIFFRSDILSFSNEGNFLESIGFEEVHYDDIMKENDTKYRWGYDDCIFYKRAFEYLDKNYKNRTKLLVGFEVSSNHYPFDEKEGYSFLYKFKSPTTVIERYINSYLVQDYCTGVFYEEFKRFDKDAHLFILHDTSFPVGNKGIYFNEEGVYNDEFLTTTVYIPPKSREDGFKTGEEINNIYSQTDILPTIFGLLNDKSYQNSFAFALKNGYAKEEYEDCQILTQPYGGGKIAIIKGKNKYVYDLTEKSLIYFNLKKDFGENDPVLVSSKMPYTQFKNEYYCERYK